MLLKEVIIMKAEKIIDKGNWEISIKKMNVLNDGVRVLKFIGREDKIPAYNAIMDKIIKRESMYRRYIHLGNGHGHLIACENIKDYRPYYQAPIETVKHINVIYNWLLNKIKEINAKRAIEADARIKAEQKRIDAICFK